MRLRCRLSTPTSETPNMIDALATGGFDQRFDRADFAFAAGCLSLPPA